MPSDSTCDEKTCITGYSHAGQPILGKILGCESARIRILIIAGQHGDEPLPIEAAMKLLDTWSVPQDVCVAVVPVANPDGLAKRSRYADGIDLNRDHLARTAPETRCIQTMLRQFRPTLVIDLHQFKSRRKWMLRRGFSHAADVCIDWTTSPVAGTVLMDSAERLGRLALDTLDSEGWRVSRYLVLSGNGVLRPCSPRIMSLLNYTAVRCGVPSLLVEVCEPTRRNADAVRRARQALKAAIETCCRLHAIQARMPSVANIHDLTQDARGSQTGGHDHSIRRIAIRGRAFRTGKHHELWIRDTASRDVRLAAMVGPYRSGWSEAQVCRPALAYGLPADWNEVAAWLSGHGCKEVSADQLPEGTFRIAQVTSITPSRNRKGHPRRVDVQWCDVRKASQPCRWFISTDETTRFLSAMLEPSSAYGAVRDGQLPWRPSIGSTYPITRLEHSGD